LPRLEVIICAGQTVSNQVRALVPVDEKETGTMKRIRWWLGVAHLGGRDLPIGGWNYPLSQATGLGTGGEIELGKQFAKALL
jgi:hypothetical protein